MTDEQANCALGRGDSICWVLENPAPLPLTFPRSPSTGVWSLGVWALGLEWQGCLGSRYGVWKQAP